MNEKTYRLLMVAAVYLTIISLILGIIVLSKNIKEITEDPIIYGMEKHEFNSCTCYQPNGNFVEIVLDDFKKDRGGD